VGAGGDDDLDERLMAEDEPFDERQPHVMTALGPIEPAALGITLVGAWGVPLMGPNRDPATALLDLEQLYATGVRAVVELDAADSEQRRADLAWLSARSPIHILTSAGIAPDDAVSEPASNVPPVRAGLRLLDGAPAGALGVTFSRLPVFISLESVQVALRGETVNSDAPHTIVADPLSASADELRGVLDAGNRLVLVAEDDTSTMPLVAALFKQLADLEFGDRLALAYRGDPITVMERMPIFLMEAGLTSADVRGILVDNPLRSLLVAGKREADQDKG
jgi:hypothetical protein